LQLHFLLSKVSLHALDAPFFATDGGVAALLLEERLARRFAPLVCTGVSMIGTSVDPA
jgi:hypothetical protein